MFIVRFLPSNRVVEVAPGVPLLDVAIHAGIAIRTDCGGAGACGKCRVSIASREVLACQIVVDADLTVRIPEDTVARQTARILTQGIGVTDERPRRDCSRSPVWDRFPNDRTPSMEHVVLGAALDIGTTTLALELIDMHTGETLGVAACENPQKRFGDDVISRIQKVLDAPDDGERMRRVLVEAVNTLIADLTARTHTDARNIRGIAVAGNSVMELLFLGLDVTSLGHAPFEPVRKYFEPVPASAVPAATHDISIHPEALVYLFPLIGGFVGGDLTAGAALVFPEHDAQRVVKCATQSIQPGRAHLPPRNRGAVVLLDIGTNGEMVLEVDAPDTNGIPDTPDNPGVCGGRRLFAAATAAGPALEGARIRQGMIAADGAIERVRWNRVTGQIDIRTIGDVSPVGICGSGLVDAVAVLLDAGVIGATGKFVAQSASLPAPFGERMRMIEKPIGCGGTEPAIELVSREHSGNGTAILLTQSDVRQVQLAVGAIRAGLRLLLAKAGLEPVDLSALHLAGGVGNYLDLKSARRIGLLPPELDPERIVAVGNTALAGALAGLCDGAIFKIAERIARETEYVDLAKCPDFAARFAEAMCFDGNAPNR